MEGEKVFKKHSGSNVRLESLDIQFPIDTVYRGMKLTENRNSKKKGG